MNWTPEQYEAYEHKQLERRLNTQQAKPIVLQSANGPQKFMVVPSPYKADKPQARKQNPEYRIQADFVKLMNARHPEILVFSDTAAHIKKTKIQQMRANALSSPREKWPDVFVAQPSGDYAGFWIEFKADSPFKKDGVTLLKNDHIEAQAATMQRLRSKGYKCEFAWDAVEAFRMVEDYLNL